MPVSIAGDGTITGFDAGLSGFGGLVAVKHVLKTDTQVSSSIATGANVAVTGLSITHTLADASNKLIISAYFGAAASSGQQTQIGIGVADDGTLVGVGDAAGSRTSVGSGGIIPSSAANYVVSMPAVTFVYEPGDTNSHTYTVRGINISGSTRTLYINRSEDDGDLAASSRASSALVIQEVAV